MTAPERQRLFHEIIASQKKSCAFMEAMAKEAVTRGTALTLWQLTEASHKDACRLLSELGGDTMPRLF